MSELIVKAQSYLSNMPYNSTEEMNDALNMVERLGYHMANEGFKPKPFLKLTADLKDNGEGYQCIDVGEQKDSVLLNSGEDYYDYICCLTLHNGVGFKEDNPLGSYRESFALGYSYRANEMLEVEENGYCLIDINAEDFNNRWETKKQEIEDILSIDHKTIDVDTKN